MPEKTRVKGDVTKKFDITFDSAKDDQFFILFKEARFPKDRVKKGLPPTTIDFIQSGNYDIDEQSDMLLCMYQQGCSSIKAMLGLFMEKAISNHLRKDAYDKKDYEKQKYEDAHNGNINKADNNLSSNE